MKKTILGVIVSLATIASLTAPAFASVATSGTGSTSIAHGSGMIAAIGD